MEHMVQEVLVRPAAYKLDVSAKGYVSAYVDFPNDKFSVTVKLTTLTTSTTSTT
eukprot:CAMPEP_0201559402 /NCGR_PEP_ID=MMETSP0173_2-20130828/73870_1 /ASSEMBLY_ACC=CAM_ASM_000268 /TAXON_ID=218659 /ORGANISM="Vexillifera sp., Strain DIVA3 564/2" /LENGTH=53 /DNA_ID=CAMNT_0047973385 /DNA_START=176 /DNA_END=334 /DNA_ORIENTATION=-